MMKGEAVIREINDYIIKNPNSSYADFMQATKNKYQFTRNAFYSRKYFLRAKGKIPQASHSDRLQQKIKNNHKVFTIKWEYPADKISDDTKTLFANFIEEFPRLKLQIIQKNEEPDSKNTWKSYLQVLEY